MGKGHHGKVAVITGAADGIGQAYAKRLAEDGVHIVVADIGSGEETAALVRAAGSQALAVQVRRLLARGRGAARARGGGPFRPLRHPRQQCRNLSAHPFRGHDPRRVAPRALDQSRRACFSSPRQFVPGMKRRGWGRIVNIASNTFGTPVTGVVHYVASKGGVIGFTRALASELGPHGITVNAIAPSLTRSPARCRPTPRPAERFALVANAQAIKRTQMPDDLVGAMSFLTSDDAAFITGQTLYVDGGLGAELAPYFEGSACGESVTMEQASGAAPGKRLRDKVCVVTGAGQGIGRAAARRLGEEGAKSSSPIASTRVPPQPFPCCARRASRPSRFSPM